MKTLLRYAGLSAAVLLMPLAAQAADHLDGPRVSADPAADINDVLAWMSPDATKINLVMTVWPAAGPAAKFSDAVTYAFNTRSAAADVFPQPAGADKKLACTFDTSQQITCTLDGISVSGDASSTTGIESPEGEIKVFAGLRNDPFFFNLAGFRATAETVTGAASSLEFDENGCPALDSATSNALVTQLKTAPGGGAAEDFFASLDTLAIVVQVDKTLLTDNGPILSVWGSTERAAQ